MATGCRLQERVGAGVKIVQWNLLWLSCFSTSMVQNNVHMTMAQAKYIDTLNALNNIGFGSNDILNWNIIKTQPNINKLLL